MHIKLLTFWVLRCEFSNLWSLKLTLQYIISQWIIRYPFFNAVFMERSEVQIMLLVVLLLNQNLNVKFWKKSGQGGNVKGQYFSDGGEMMVWMYDCTSSTYLDTEIPACQNPCGENIHRQVEHCTSRHTHTSQDYLCKGKCQMLSTICVWGCSFPSKRVGKNITHADWKLQTAGTFDINSLPQIHSHMPPHTVLLTWAGTALGQMVSPAHLMYKECQNAWRRTCTPPYTHPRTYSTHTHTLIFILWLQIDNLYEC